MARARHTGSWLGLSFSAPLFFPQVPGRKKMGGCKGQSCSLKESDPSAQKSETHV